MTYEVRRNYSQSSLEKVKMKFKRLEGANDEMKVFSLSRILEETSKVEWRLRGGEGKK